MPTPTPACRPDPTAAARPSAITTHSKRSAAGPGLRGTWQAQRAAGDGDRVHHPAGPGKRCRAGGHRGRLPGVDPDADPDGRRGRPPLSVHLRQAHQRVALSGPHQTVGVRRAAHRAARPRAGLHPPRAALSVATTARSITRSRTGRTTATPTSMTSPSPADRTTGSSRRPAGAPAKTPTATPNGSPHPTSTPDNAGSTDYHHPENTSSPKTTKGHENCCYAGDYRLLTKPRS